MTVALVHVADLGPGVRRLLEPRGASDAEVRRAVRAAEGDL